MTKDGKTAKLASVLRCQESCIDSLVAVATLHNSSAARNNIDKTTCVSTLSIPLNNFVAIFYFRPRYKERERRAVIDA